MSIRLTESYQQSIAECVSAVPGIEELFGKTVLITGATGMVCSPVVDLLLYLNRTRAAEIRVLAAGRSRERLERRFCTQSGENGLFFVPYDATSSGKIDCGSVDYVIHGASNASPAVYVREPVETILANVSGLDAVLKTAVGSGAKRLLFISSSEVYGKKTSAEPYGETDYGYVDILNPRAGYPLSKRTGESLCIAYGQEYGMGTVIARLGHIYGPTITNTDSRASAEFTRCAAKGEAIVMKSAGAQLRSYCYCLDCATALLTILLRGENGNAYNVSNPGSICSIREIAETIAKAGGVPLIFDMPTEEERRGYNLMDNSSLRSDKLESLGWRALFPLEEGVKQTMELYQE